MKSKIKDSLVKLHRAEIEGAIFLMEEKINPNTPVLTPMDRQLYGRNSGNASKLLVDDVLHQVTTHPELKSPLIDWDDFTSDNNASNVLETMITRLNSLVYKLESAKMLHDYDNYNDAIDQYSHLDYLSRNNVQGAAESHRILKEHFKRSKPAKAE